jgi:MoxR-like ATPase
MQTVSNVKTESKFEPGHLVGRSKLQMMNQVIGKQIVGQSRLIENILVCLISGGHLLIEGMPGLAKTTAAKAVATGIDGKFGRVQFTPDLLPSDLIGTEIYVHDQGLFSFRPGPIFNNIVLADEINRAPAKVQSALLEAMEERQVTVGNTTHKLPELFMVIATQNPIEQEGTYNLPEAQLDRFLMRAVIDYPNSIDELEILKRSENKVFEQLSPLSKTPQTEILQARKAAQNIYVSDALRSYIVSIVTATRAPEKYDPSLAKWISHGASPRATIALLKTAKALAWLRGSEYVTPEHIQAVAVEVLAHRIYPSYESESSNISRIEIIERVLKLVAVP